METIETLATFFGWCTVINFGILLVVFLFSRVFHEGVSRFNAKSFGVSQDEAKATWFRVFQQYRLALIVLSAVPFLALKIMGG